MALDLRVGHDLGQSYAHRAAEEEALDRAEHGADRRLHEVKRAIAAEALL